MLSEAAEQKIWRELADAGAAAEKRPTAMKAIEAAIAEHQRTKQRPFVGREKQQESARTVLNAVRKLREAIATADRETRKRLRLRMADKGEGKKGERRKLGEQRMRKFLDTIEAAAERSLERAKKKSNRGKKAEAPVTL